MIDAAGKNGRIDLALVAYQNAIHPNHYTANVITHSSMIDAAGKNGRIDLAMEAYANAIHPDNYAANGVTHSSMIDAAGRNGRIDLAMRPARTCGVTTGTDRNASSTSCDMRSYYYEITKNFSY